MGVDVHASIDCDGLVTLIVSNGGTATFRGQSGTAGSWNVPLVLAPGESTTAQGKFPSQFMVTGFVQGRYDGDPAFVNTPWTAVVACEIPTTTTTTTVLDLTPKPVTDMPGMCNQPGSNPPLAVPCDSPEASLPYQPTPTAPVDTTPVTEPPVASEVTGPPRTHAVISTTHARPAALPETGPTLLGPELALAGLCAAIGVVLIRFTTRERRP